MSIISERIRERRQHRGMSADEVSALIGVSRATVFRWENGDTEKIKIDVLCELARILDTTPAYLLGWSETEQEEKTRNLRELFDMFVKYRGDDVVYPDELKDSIMQQMVEFFDYIMYRETRRRNNAVSEVSSGIDG